MNENAGLRRVPALDGPMVLFQDVIKILHRSMPAVLLQNTIGFELNDGWWIAGVLVGVDDPRRRIVIPAQGFGQKAFRRCWIAFLAERRKSIVAPLESTARYKYTHCP